MMKNFDDIFIRFDRMYERDRHTQTDRYRRTIGRACIASRGKIEVLVLLALVPAFDG